MTRVLDFAGARGPKRFELLRTALLSAGDGKGERVRERIRKEARLLDALDSVSDPTPIDGDPDRRSLKPDGGKAVINQDDCDLLLTYVDTTPWVPRVARDAVDLQDWLTASERLD